MNIKRKYCYFFFILLLGCSSGVKTGNTIRLYVSTTGNDTNDGSILKPFATIEKAKNTVKKVKSESRTADIEVIIRKGVYELKSTLLFLPEDGGDASQSITYLAYPGEEVVISGGNEFTLDWEKESGHIWKSKARFKNNKSPDVVRTLYLNGKRLTRATSETLFTVSGYPKYSKSFTYGAYDFTNIRRLKEDSIDAFCGFKFSGKDIDEKWVGSSAEVILYGSWEASWHKIHSVSKQSKTVVLKNPARYPVGFFNARTRYRIENLKDFLNSSGNWCFDNKTGYLYYYTEADNTPPSTGFASGVLERLILVKGNSRPVVNLTFKNLSFRYTNSGWNVSDTPQNVVAQNMKKHPWLDFNCGFMASQGAFESGEAILLEEAEKCKIVNCNFTGLDTYAVKMGKYSKNNTVSGCSVYDCGSGGILIGFRDKQQSEGSDVYPSYSTITGNKIFNCGLLHPSGIGIALLEAHHITISQNEIFNMPYTGISCGFTFGDGETVTAYNNVTDNVIHDVMQQLADGGGIYTLGKQKGSVYSGNYIYNIGRKTDAVGAYNNGFFFDEGSADFTVENNAVKGVKNKDIRFNQADSTKINWGKNHFEKQNENLDIFNKLSKRKYNAE
ncbi:MAG: right-handed parallel beta-helix repeat-containing protein [Bacteroidota bacterium]